MLGQWQVKFNVVSWYHSKRENFLTLLPSAPIKEGEIKHFHRVLYNVPSLAWGPFPGDGWCCFFKGRIPHRGRQQPNENWGDGNKSLLSLMPYQTVQAINPGSWRQGTKLLVSLPLPILYRLYLYFQSILIADSNQGIQQLIKHNNKVFWTKSQHEILYRYWLKTASEYRVSHHLILIFLNQCNNYLEIFLKKKTLLLNSSYFCFPDLLRFFSLQFRQKKTINQLILLVRLFASLHKHDHRWKYSSCPCD